MTVVADAKLSKYCYKSSDNKKNDRGNKRGNIEIMEGNIFIYGVN